MKKILLFIDNLDKGGVSTVLLDLLENIDLKKYDITVMSLYHNGYYQKNVQEKVKYKYCFNVPDPNDNRFLSQLYRKYWSLMLKIPPKIFYRCFIHEKYDIEIAFMHGRSTQIISASSNKKSKKMAWVHVDLVTWNKADRLYKSIEAHKRVYQKFDKVICVSNAVEKGMKEKYDLINTCVIYNPVNEEKILAMASEKQSEISEGNSIEIMTVGRFEKEKGYNRLLKVCSRLDSAGIDFHLTIIGDGTEYQLYKDFIQNNNLCEKIRLLGFQDNPFKYLKQADFFVCSSLSEGFSLAIVEALVLGIPVLSVNCAGPQEILNFGEYGIVVENTEDALYDGMKKISSNNFNYEYYRKLAIKRGSFFSISSFILSIVEILDN